MIDIIVDEKDLSFNRLEKEIYAFLSYRKL